ncbi:hypothetical protein JE006_22985 [Pseudomonas aeruginosa]|nr:hypothetical protein [Pseudomonas aeruginosa]HEJ1837309.1 hypothetical protein [Pseudomonas aeruginosa]HEK3577562.1 hypothetical protein [Pseudomonas aeruginosa]HEK3590451.1 hypothetical protein [Pseudomonas aeruginosa]
MKSKINKIAEILEIKFQVNASSLYELDDSTRLKPARLTMMIKGLLLNLSIRERHTIPNCLVKTYFNHVNKVEPAEDFLSLSDYSTLRSTPEFTIRPSEIKRLLEKKLYLFGDYPTNKSYRLGAVYTNFIDYQINRCKRKKEILKLWKVSFLDRVINSQPEIFSECRKSFSFTRPRTENEGLNCINRTLAILAVERPDFAIDKAKPLDDTLAHLMSLQVSDDRTKSLIKYLRRHILFRAKMKDRLINGRYLQAQKSPN